MKPLPPDSLAAALLNVAGILADVAAGKSLAEGLMDKVPVGRRPAVQDIVYGSLRDFGLGDALLDALLDQPLKHPVVRGLLLAGVHLLGQQPEKAYTTVDQVVEAAGFLERGRFRGLCNAVLRNFLRRQTELVTQVQREETVVYRHPAWWINRLKIDHPAHWEAILAVNNSHPPMALRVNTRKTSRDAYLAMLGTESLAAMPVGRVGLVLERPVPVSRLPRFDEGWVSVQDPGAQRAAELLEPPTGSRVLDACAAPGGKSAHMLEQSDIQLTALELSARRGRRIHENLNRLQLMATVQTGDACRPAHWWDGVPFDAILADVPCSASGVVRRHPDAKWLRREGDIAKFAAVQREMLAALWPCLRAGGKLLYATCSVFRAENQAQIANFLARHADAALIHEEPLLPSSQHDGFYYALLHKLD